MANDNKTYHEQKKIEYTQKLRDVLSTMPTFCKDFFRAIDQTASAKTKLSYAYDIRLFFNYISETNPLYKNKAITEYKIEMLKPNKKSKYYYYFINSYFNLLLTGIILAFLQYLAIESLQGLILTISILALPFTSLISFL